MTIAVEKLSEIFRPPLPSIENYVICTEKHQDGTPHLHALVVLSSKVNIRNAGFADLTFGSENFHGNYQGTRNLRDVACYVTKEDMHVTSSQTWLDRIRSTKVKITDTVAERIMSGVTLRSLTEQYPGHVMNNLSRIQLFQAWYRRTQWEAVPLPRINLTPNPNESLILSWLAHNIFAESPRQLRTPQLYLYGSPGTGKSSFVAILEKSFKTFKPSYSVQWWDGFDETIELIIFDEFKGQIKCTFMNQILDGQTVIIPRRHGDFTKTNNIPVIICSNFAPCSIYNNTDSVEAFLGRLKLVTLNSFINVFNQ